MNHECTEYRTLWPFAWSQKGLAKPGSCVQWAAAKCFEGFLPQLRARTLFYDLTVAS